MSKIAILGASRGLGSELARKIVRDQDEGSLLLVARNRNNLESIKKELLSLAGQKPFKIEIFQSDFSKEQDQERSLQALKTFQADQIFYCAGGGPHGKFSSKEWKDHLWSLQVSLIFPTRLTHWCLLQAQKMDLPRQLVLVGSSISEATPEPLGSSYSASKHGLKGLVHSINAEGDTLDLRLFSPGYMDTELLPSGAAPRSQGQVWPKHIVAQKLWHWSQSPHLKSHLSLSSFLES